MKITHHLVLASLAGVLALTACKSTPEMRNRPGFLSTYDYLRKVDDTTWRYVNPTLLGKCDKFIVSPVKILFNEVEGKPVTAEQRQRSAHFVREAIIQAMANRYAIVTEPGPGVGEIRVAITDAYRTGGKVGLSVEGEILDNSNTQVAAVMRTELSEHYVPGWENKATARKMVDTWAKRLRQTIDEAQAQK